MVFLVVAPGIVAGAVPYLITGWHIRAYSAPVQMAGAFMVFAGVFVLVACFVGFAFEGLGTPAPLAPTRRLVVGGFYRYVRNPMYLAVGAIIGGQAILLGQLALLVYLLLFALAVVVFVYGYEEPTLLGSYGGEYEQYRRAVPAWLPRLTPWRGPTD